MADETKDKTTDEEKDQVEETSEASDEEEEEVESSQETSDEEDASTEDADDDDDADADDASEDDAEEDESTSDDDEDADASDSDSEEDDSDEDDAEEEDDDEDVEASFAPGEDDLSEDDASEDEDEEEDDDDLFDVEPSEDDDDSSDEDEDDDAEDLEEESDADADDSDDDITLHTVSETSASSSEDDTIDGLAAYFDYPAELLHAGEVMRDAEKFELWDLYSPFPIHGFEEAMGIGRSWLPWVTFLAGGTGFTLANLLQFGTLTFDWPMIIGGKPYAPWPSFVPIMFELTVLIGGVTTALVMFIASGCFRKPRIIDPEITNDRFVLWIDANDPNFDEARAFMEDLDPVEIRDIRFES